MNINYPLLKHFLIVLLSLFAAYQIFALASSILARPKIHDLNFKPINQVMMQSSTQSVSPTLTTDSAQFDIVLLAIGLGLREHQLLLNEIINLMLFSKVNYLKTNTNSLALALILLYLNIWVNNFS